MSYLRVLKFALVGAMARIVVCSTIVGMDVALGETIADVLICVTR